MNFEAKVSWPKYAYQLHNLNYFTGTPPIKAQHTSRDDVRKIEYSLGESRQEVKPLLYALSVFVLICTYYVRMYFIIRFRKVVGVCCMIRAYSSHKSHQSRRLTFPVYRLTALLCMPPGFESFDTLFFHCWTVLGHCCWRDSKKNLGDNR